MFRPIPFSPIRTTLYSPRELMETFDPDDYQSFERTLGIIDDLPSEELPETLHWRPTVTNIYIPSQSFLDSGFTHLILAKSPGYTPPTADALVPIIEQYFDPI